MRSFMIAAVAALAFAGAAYAHGTGSGAGKIATAQPSISWGAHHYQWDLARKRCHDERGKPVSASLCKTHRDPPSGLPTGRRQ